VELLLYVLGAVALIVGVAGVVLPGLPGTPLLVVGVVLVAWAEKFTRVGWVTIAAAVLIAAMIVAVDWIAGVLGAKAFGASRWALVGAGVGVLVGLFFGLPGVILGPALGAVALEYWKNPGLVRALKAGLGVFVGFVVGSVVKIALVFVLLGVVAVALFA
jgi:uncharacterized protein YqgC (DUF456 family)